VKAEVDRMLNEFDYQLKGQGISLNDYFKYTNIDEGEFKENLKGDAKKKIETDLALEKVVEVEEIEASEEEVEKELEEMAKQYGQEVEELKKVFNDAQMDYVKDT